MKRLRMEQNDQWHIIFIKDQFVHFKDAFHRSHSFNGNSL